MIRSLRAIAVQSLHHAVRTRVFLLVSVGTLLLLFLNLEGYLPDDSGGVEGELRRETWIRVAGAEDLLSLWVEGAALAGLFLGATAVSSDLRTRTLESLLTRPVPRPIYLVGRWIGIQILVVGFSLAGISLSFWLLGLSRLDPSPLLWVGLSQLLVTAILLSTLGMALGVRWHPVTAGSAAVSLVMLPSLVLPYLGHPGGLVRWAARTVYSLGPAVPQERLISDAFAQSLLNPSYELPLLVLLENGTYVVAALVLGCIVMQRREIRPPA